tara:strand:+ start:326 stop:868 length:543 start_codon:yes stop_codon:yes gene_type:complete
MDNDFAKSLKDSDLNAYRVLYDKYYARLYNYACKLSNDRNLSKDIVQESFIKLWINRQKINPELSLGNYLFKICLNEFLADRRKKNKEKAFLDQIKIEIVHEMLLPFDDDTAQIDEVKRIIDELSPKCKEAFILSKYEQMKYKVIAEKMGISIKTVENHIAKAHAELRKKLGFLASLFLW